MSFISKFLQRKYVNHTNFVPEKYNVIPNSIIIEGKVYNISTSQEIFSRIIWITDRESSLEIIYKSVKNNYFSICLLNSSRCISGKTYTEAQAKEMACKFLPVSKVVELFGEFKEG